MILEYPPAYVQFAYSLVNPLPLVICLCLTLADLTLFFNWLCWLVSSYTMQQVLVTSINASL